jgi:ADP-ribose pyrophosphatase
MLISQFRYPLNQRILELPAGKLDPNEDPLECARREMEEETGWLAAEWTKLGSIYTSVGFCDEVLHLFMARDLTESSGGHRRTEGESDIDIMTIPLSDAITMIRHGEIRDAKTICGLMMAVKQLRELQ